MQICKIEIICAVWEISPKPIHYKDVSSMYDSALWEKTVLSVNGTDKTCLNLVGHRFLWKNCYLSIVRCSLTYHHCSYSVMQLSWIGYILFCRSLLQSIYCTCLIPTCIYLFLSRLNQKRFCIRLSVGFMCPRDLLNEYTTQGRFRTFTVLVRFVEKNPF